MKMQIIGIFDRKSQSFVEMSATPALGVATRSFTEAVNKPSESPVHKWPGDFELWHLGDWDTDTGMPSRLNDDKDQYAKRLIVTGDAVKAPAN